MRLKLVSKIEGNYVPTTFFLGEGMFQNAGTLRLRKDEWQLVWSALIEGARHLDGQLDIVTNEQEVLEALAKERRLNAHTLQSL